MPSAPAVIDVEGLLAPIPGESPVGESLQYAGLYDQIREARRADDGLSQGEWKRDSKESDWDEVVSLGTDALESRTKDVQIGAWLAEGLVRVSGFAGCRDALKLLSGLLERYWDTLYPEIDDGDLEGRANIFAFVDRQTALALKEVPVTRSPAGSLSWNALEDSRTGPPAKASDFEELKAEQEKKTDEFRKAVNGTPKVFYETASETLSECWAAYQELDRVLDDRFGRETPGLSTLRKSLEDVRADVDKLLKEKRALEPDAAQPAAGGSADEAGGGQEGYAYASGVAVAGVTGPIRTRADALSRLKQVAEFFRATEPHSPVSYLVTRAVSWGEMTLDSWLAEVVKDSGTLDHIRETLGIRPPENG